MELHGATLDGGVNAANRDTGGVMCMLTVDNAPVLPAHELVGPVWPAKATVWHVFLMLGNFFSFLQTPFFVFFREHAVRRPLVFGEFCELGVDQHGKRCAKGLASV